MLFNSFSRLVTEDLKPVIKDANDRGFDPRGHKPIVAMEAGG